MISWHGHTSFFVGICEGYLMVASILLVVGLKSPYIIMWKRFHIEECNAVPVDLLADSRSWDNASEVCLSVHLSNYFCYHWYQEEFLRWDPPPSACLHISWCHRYNCWELVLVYYLKLRRLISCKIVIAQFQTVLTSVKCEHDVLEVNSALVVVRNGYIDGLVQDCHMSIANTLEIPQSSTKPWI